MNIKSKSSAEGLLRSILLLVGLIGLLSLSGCATPLGQQYGMGGGLAGAAIGGAAGGLPGAIMGGAAGAAAGGLLGDQQSGRGYGREHDYDRGYDQRPGYGYEQPRRDCHWAPRYDRFGYEIDRIWVCY